MLPALFICISNRHICTILHFSNILQYLATSHFNHAIFIQNIKNKALSNHKLTIKRHLITKTLH